MKKIYLDWHDFGVGVDILAVKIKKDKIKFDGIYGVPRGGLCIAVALAHRLNLPLLMYPTKDCLVVDDISDTGKTLRSFKDRLIATIHSTKWTKTKPNWYVWDKYKKTDWIIYPWEVDG